MTRLRRVVDDPVLRSGRGSFLGPDTSRRIRWWDVVLDCGHRAEVRARYRPRTDEHPPGSPRVRSDLLPGPRRAACPHEEHR